MSAFFRRFRSIRPSISIHLIRRSVQWLVFAGFIIIPLLNSREVYALVGNLLGFTVLGVPFADPLSVVQTGLGALGFTREALVGAGLTLLIAIALGPVFCSWVCPYGLLSELVHAVRKHPVPAPKTSARPFMVRCAIAGLGLLAVATFVPFPFLNQLSLPGWITRFWQSVFLFETLLWAGLLIPLFVLGMESFFRKRVWCRYLCPQSVLIALVGFLVPTRLRVTFNPRQCTCPAKDRACYAACSLSLNPRQGPVVHIVRTAHDSRPPQAGQIPQLPQIPQMSQIARIARISRITRITRIAQAAQCTNCGDCIDACKNRGRALNFCMGRAVDESPNEERQ